MIKIRLQRKGRIRRPIYHIVVADSRSPRDGRIIEQVGRYDGVTEKKETVINEERISYWLDQGAKPTDAVQKILRHQGFLYKRHLQMWGKSEEEINAAIEEWKANRESKEQAEVSRKDQVRASLIAEEKEVKKQIKQKASAAAAEMEKEAEETAAAKAAAEQEPEKAKWSLPEPERRSCQLNKWSLPPRSLPLNKWSLPPRKQPIQSLKNKWSLPTKKLPLNKWSLPPRKQPIQSRN